MTRQPASQPASQPATQPSAAPSASTPAPPDGRRGPVVVGRTGLALAGLLALAMAALFALAGSGASLLVTFVPGVVIAWGILAHFHATDRPLPHAEAALPALMAGIAWQGLHFAEEHQAGFATAFPALYGGAPYSIDVFTWFNMAAYAAFAMSAVAALVLGRSPLYLPPLFFAVYGAIGNAISHIVFAVLVGGYFPGLVTGLGYLVLGPVLLRRLWPAAGWRGPAVAAGAFCLIAVPLQIALAVR